VYRATLGLTLAMCAAPARGGDAAAGRAFLDRLDTLGFDGVVYIARGDEVLIGEGYGLANRDTGLAWSPEVISTVGSITKQFTGAAILKLEEMGKLAVTDTLPAHFDDVPDDKRSITLHQLLTHSSGIQELPGLGDFDPITREAFIERALAAPLAFEPGSRYEYSNAGYSLLGAVIEMRTGGTYEQFLHEQLFAPLGMKHTGYRLLEWSPERLAHGYLDDGSDWGTIIEHPMAEDGPYWALRANGGISSTARDMHTWALALLDGKVLGPESMAKLWGAHVDESNGDGESYYGYGWVSVDLPDGTKVLMHNGGNGIHGADYMIVPDRRLVLFAQSNVLRETRLVFNVLQMLGMHLVFDRPLPEVPRAKRSWSPPAGLADGTYTSDGGDTVVVRVLPGGIEVEARSPGALALMHGRGDLDQATLDACSERTRLMVEGILAGDFGPAAAEYGDNVPIEELRESYTRLKESAAGFAGPLEGWSVVGSAIDGEHIDTVVRFDHRLGPMTLVFAFAADGDNRLLGRHDGGGLGLSSVYHPAEDGSYFTFDEQSWSMSSIALRRDGDALHLVIGGVAFAAPVG
jgi:CubicO group peptidase (beta-lactamase class C family)